MQRAFEYKKLMHGFIFKKKHNENESQTLLALLLYPDPRAILSPRNLDAETHD